MATRRIIRKAAGSDRAEDVDIKYGYYSAEAESHGVTTCVYTEPRSGKEVIVTGIFSDPFARSYKWKDKVFVGPVDQFVRRNEMFNTFLI